MQQGISNLNYVQYLWVSNYLNVSTLLTDKGLYLLELFADQLGLLSKAKEL